MAGLGAHALEPGGHGTQLKSQDLVSSSSHPGSREASQWLCNKDLWDLNRLDKCYFEVEKEQFMTPFFIIIIIIIVIVLKRSKLHKISSVETVVLINLCPHPSLLVGVRLSTPGFHARFRDRLCSVAPGADTAVAGPCPCYLHAAQRPVLSR